jgi:hypothetical protein
MNASNLIVKSDMRFRKSSKLKSTEGSWVRGVSEYDMLGAACDCEARNEDVLVENCEEWIAVDMVAFIMYSVQVLEDCCMGAAMVGMRKIGGGGRIIITAIWSTRQPTSACNSVYLHFTLIVS